MDINAAFLDKLLEAEKGAEIILDDLEQEWKVDRKDVVDLIKKYDADGYGRFVIGRRGAKSRFVVGMTDKAAPIETPVSRLADAIMKMPEKSGVPADYESAPDPTKWCAEHVARRPCKDCAKPKVEVETTGRGYSVAEAGMAWAVHHITIREGFRVSLALPKDLTARERAGLIEKLSTLNVESSTVS